MLISKDLIHDVRQSLGRCYLMGGFIERFARNFKTANPAIPLFIKTDPGREHKLLKDGLTWLVMSVDDCHLARREIRDQLNIHPQLYRYWVEALLLTVREFDEKFTPDLEKKWRVVLQEGMHREAEARLEQISTPPA